MVKISIIVPVYNVEEFLRKCLDSIVNQTFKDIEIICVNDGSTDSSLEIIEEYAKKDNRIMIISQKNKGLGEARNKGMEFVNGEYILFVDSDDWLELTAIEKLYNNAISNNSDIVLYDSIEHKDNNIFKERIFFKKNSKIDYNNFVFDYSYDKRLVLNRMVVAWSKLYRTSFLKDNSIKFVSDRLFEDVPFHLEVMLKASRISYLPEILYNYNRLNLNSLQNSKPSYNKRLILFRIFDILKNILIETNYYKDFKLEFIEFKILQSKVNFDLTMDEFKEDFYNHIRSEFINMRLDWNIIKKLPIKLTKFYIIVLNFDLFQDYYDFSQNVGKINCKSMSKN